MLATDIAEYLVRKNVPFRETHHIAGCCSCCCYYYWLLFCNVIVDAFIIIIIIIIIIIVGAAVKLAETKGIPLDKLTLEDLVL